MIEKIKKSDHYVIDTHTAVAASVYEDYQTQTKDGTKTLIVSTASPYKFARSVMSAIHPADREISDFELIDKLSDISGTKIPQAIEEIRTAPILHNTVCKAEEMQKTVERILSE